MGAGQSLGHREDFDQRLENCTNLVVQSRLDDSEVELDSDCRLARSVEHQKVDLYPKSSLVSKAGQSSQRQKTSGVTERDNAPILDIGSADY